MSVRSPPSDRFVWVYARSWSDQAPGRTRPGFEPGGAAVAHGLSGQQGCEVAIVDANPRVGSRGAARSGPNGAAQRTDRAGNDGASWPDVPAGVTAVHHESRRAAWASRARREPPR